MKSLIHNTARQELATLFPALDNHNCACPRHEHWAMLNLFLFNPWIDENTGAIRVGAEVISRALNKHSEFKSGNFNAGKYLNHFMNFIIPGIGSLVRDELGRDYSVSTWEETENGFRKTEEGIQRRVLINWPEAVKQIVYNETHNLYTDDKVYITTGFKKNVAKQIKARKDQEADCNNVIEMAATPMAKYIARYHHALPVNGFTSILENAEEAQRVIDGMMNPNARLQQTMILDIIKESPKPLYKPTERSDRLFGHGANLTNLSKEVRKVLTQGWVEFDLKQAQLAIVGKLWNISEVNDFLKTGKSFWKEISSHLGIELTDEVKGALKKATYATIFGMSKVNLLAQLTGDLGEVLAKAFLSHYIIKALLKARTVYIEKVLKNGFIIDPFTKVHQVNKRNVLSIIAREAQAYEQVLLYPIYELTNTTQDFTVQLFQHDGLSICFHNTNTRDLWIERICDVVSEAAKKLDIHTYLEYSENANRITSMTVVEEEIVNTSPVVLEVEVVVVVPNLLAEVRSLTVEQLEIIYFDIQVNRKKYSEKMIEILVSEYIKRSL